MSIDMTQFHQTFLEESFEGLDHMEKALLALGDAPADSDVVHGIFRAAHSIKGGSATFGFKAVADFTHLVETLLDRLRSGERAIEQPLVDVLLRRHIMLVIGGHQVIGDRGRKRLVVEIAHDHDGLIEHEPLRLFCVQWQTAYLFLYLMSTVQSPHQVL